VLLAAALVGGAQADAARDAAVRAGVAQPVLAGQGRLTFLGLSVYDARLWVGPAFEAGGFANHPFVLELAYLRGLQGAQIARRSVEEMRRSGPLPDEQASRWEAAGDRIAGVHRPGRGAVFLVNGKPAGEIADPEFARRFFAIWLAPTTSEPALRAALLGAR
jgi:glucose/arabinose dehydrogenase